MRGFVDSCIFIEALKKEGEAECSKILEILFEALFNLDNDFFVNGIVYSEVVYKLVTKNKKKREIDSEFVYSIFETFSWLDLPYEVKELAEKYIKELKLKPNDALILATCKHYRIGYLISFDEDFKEPCEKEGIILIDSAKKLKEILTNT